MLFAIEHRDDLENSEELTSSKNQLEEFRLQDKLGKKTELSLGYKKIIRTTY